MKKIQFTKKHGRHEPGWVIGTTDSGADALVAQGVAVYVAPDVRALRYAPAAPVQVECVAPVTPPAPAPSETEADPSTHEPEETQTKQKK